MLRGNPAGVSISGLGAIQRSGGGQAASRAARRWAVAEGAQFVLLQPLDRAARIWWEGWGFKFVADALRLRLHRQHNCEIFRLTHQRLSAHLSEEIRATGADVDLTDLITTLQDNSIGRTPVFMLWIHPSPAPEAV